MGDKSPKSTRKQANQKQTRTDAAQPKKTEIEVPRQAGNDKPAKTGPQK